LILFVFTLVIYTFSPPKKEKLYNLTHLKNVRRIE